EGRHCRDGNHPPPPRRHSAFLPVTMVFALFPRAPTACRRTAPYSHSQHGNCRSNQDRRGKPCRYIAKEVKNPHEQHSLLLANLIYASAFQLFARKEAARRRPAVTAGVDAALSAWRRAGRA